VPENDSSSQAVPLLAVGDPPAAPQGGALADRLRDSEQRLRGSQELLRLATELTGTGVWELDIATGGITHNDVCFALFGIDSFGGTYEDFLAMVHPEDRSTVTARIRHAIDERVDYDCEYRVVWPDGTVRWIAGRGRALYARDGPPLRMVGTLVDVTDRHAEQRLRESEERLRQVAEHVDAVLFVAEPDLSRVHYVSPAYERVFGRPVETLYESPKSFIDAVHPDDRGRVAATMAAQDRSGAIEYRVVRPDGSVRWVRDRMFPVRDEAGRVARVTGIAEDVTEQMAAEAAVREGEERFRAFMDNGPAVAFMKDEQGRYVYFNRRFADTFGATPEAWLGRTDFDLRPEPLARELRESDLRVLREGRPVAVDVTVPDPAGREFHWLGMKFPFRDSAGRLLVGGVAVDVTERVRAEAGMREVSDRYQALFDSTFDAVIMHEAGVVLGMNRAACELFGYAQEEVLGRYAIDMVLPPESREWVLRQIRAGTESCYETVMWRKDGTTFPAEIRGRTIDYKGRAVRVASIRDLTARKAEEAARHAVEEQVAQSQRLEAVGRLAGGIAHEFNNLLTIIIGYCEPAAKEAVVARLPSGGELFEVVRAAERGAELAGQLLTFARKRPVQPEPFALDAMMERVKAMLARLLGEGIELVCPHESGLWPVLADAGQVEQVLVNLALNARDAMPQGGTLTIESDNADLTPDDPARPADLRPGRYVRLAVSDSGVGMSEEVRQHAFEPFYTTKGIGRGTGLGLSICYGIVRQNGGHISLRSGAEAGTTFTIYLPAATSPAPPRPAPPPPPEDAPRAARGQTVLLAEDETLIRVVAARALRARGYQVIEAGDGQDALEQAKKHPGPLHALVTDVGMPRIGGIELARRLRENVPGLPVLFCTGYGEEAVQGERVVRKPFRPADLAAAVDALLDGPRAGSKA
jgi:PAS domain S-box-containing protein